MNECNCKCKGPDNNATARGFEAVCRILDENNYDKDRLIPILQSVQGVYRYLPEDVISLVASSLGLSPARVYGVATFYSHFTLQPKGKYVIKVCDGTACHVKGSMNIYDAMRKKLSLPEGKNTTSDLMFTLETVSCLGACGLAPVIVVNEEVHGQMTPERGKNLIDKITDTEATGEKKHN